MNLNKIKNEFNQSGFVIIRKLFSAADIKKIISLIPEITNAMKNYENRYIHFTKDGRPNTIHNIYDFVSKNHFVNKIGTKKKLIKILKNLLDGEVNIRNVEFFLKPRKTGKDAPFHQDNYYWNIINGEAVNVWISCSKVNKKNGGLIYLSGSHKLGTIKHSLSYKAGSSQKIPDSIFIKLKKIFRTQSPNLNPGDCIIHHCEIIHGSKKNNSNIDRQGLVVSFKKKKAKYNLQSIESYKKSLERNIKVIKRNK